MGKRQVAALAKRAGVTVDPLARIETIGEFKDALRGMSDFQLIVAYERHMEARVARMTDDELIEAHHKAQQEGAGQSTED